MVDLQISRNKLSERLINLKRRELAIVQSFLLWLLLSFVPSFFIMALMLLSLEEQEQSIISAINGNAMVIYWHHRVGEFTHLIASDNNLFHEEIKQVRRQFRNGRFTTITAGDTLNVNGTDLYTMEVEIPGLKCFPYFLLGRTGDLDMADKTPYFFKSRATRDKTIAFVTRPQP